MQQEQGVQTAAELSQAASTMQTPGGHLASGTLRLSILFVVSMTRWLAPCRCDGSIRQASCGRPQAKAACQEAGKADTPGAAGGQQPVSSEGS